MGVPIFVYDLGSMRVTIDAGLDGKYRLSILQLGYNSDVLCTNPNGVYFFDRFLLDERVSPRYNKTVEFPSYQAAELFIHMFDPDLLVDKYHCDAIINS